MQRVVEPELMNDQTQAEAYAGANFEEAHARIVQAFDINFPGIELEGSILDLGCGPGDIALRFAARFPNSSVLGVDGSGAMIRLANQRRADATQLRDRVAFVEGFIPGAPIPPGPYSAIVSNSLLHHLHHPDGLWQTVSLYASPGTKIFIADLFRPISEEVARKIVDRYSQDEPEILRRDFYNSLLAAFEPEEIRQQLARAQFTELEVKEITDRHLLIFGEKS